MDQKELFANYEFNSSNWNKFIFKLLGGSLIFHVIILLFLVYVPAVRDAFYIALLFSDANNRTYSDKTYNKTEIEDGDTASVISLPPSDQLEYPKGYFNLANGDVPPPDMIAMTSPHVPEAISASNDSIPGFPGFTFEQPATTPTPFPRPTNINPIPPPFVPKSVSRNLPPPLKKPKNGKVPSFEDVNGGNGGGIPGIPQSSPTVSATPKKDETAKTETEKKDETSQNPASGLNINKKPLEDFGKIIKEKLAKKEIDLNADFSVDLGGEFDNDGKIQKLKVLQKSGDDKMIDTATQMLAAVNDSGWLKLLDEMYKSGNKKAVFSVSQDKDKVSFTIQSERENNERADSLYKVLSSSLGLGAMFVKGPDELLILKSTSVKSDGKQVIINLNMPRAVASEMINRKLTEAKPSEQPSQVTIPNAQAAN